MRVLEIHEGFSGKMFSEMFCTDTAEGSKSRALYADIF